MYRNLVLVASAFIFSLCLHAQPTLMWANAYNGPGNNADQAGSVAVDAAGNSYVTGGAFSSNGTLDMVTIKYSPAGQQLWLHNFNGSADVNDQANMIVLDAAGNVYITGYTNNLNSGQDITTIKYNTNGVMQWVQYYDGAFSNADVGIALTVDNAGNVYVTGTQMMPGTTTDFITLKYSTTGVLLWFQSYNGPGNANDDAKDIKVDVSGNVYVTGTSDTLVNSVPNEDIVLLKYNSNGVPQWRKVYDDTAHGYQFSRKLAVDRRNNIIVTGYSFVTGNGYDIFIFKWDSSGIFKWMRTYNYAANTFESPNAIVTDSLDNIIVTGQGIAPSSGSTNDYVTVKWDSSGTFQWASRYNNIFHGEDRAQAIALDDSLCVYVTGYSKGTGTGFDIATVKYDPAGNQVYVLRYNNNAVNLDDVGYAIAVRNGDIYVAGGSLNATDNDYITLRYSYGTPLAAPVSEEPQRFSFSIYPNPSHGVIHAVLPDDMNTTDAVYSVGVFDVSGQLVMSLNSVQQSMENGKPELVIPDSELPPGFYLLRIADEKGSSATLKFIAE